ncbi:MAG: hypothetical protein ACHQ0J_01810 [Candidatus Dormibacterales bacterium]
MDEATTRATPAEQQVIDAAVAHLRARVAAANAYRADVRPPPGSDHARAVEGWRGNEPGPLAELLLLSADYHLLTFMAALSTRELYPLGGYTLLRGAAEPAARAAWLMDPAITPKARRARVLVERLNALQERRKFAGQRKPADDRIKTLVGDATALGHRAVDGKQKKPDHFGEVRPAATTLFARLLPDIAAAGADPVGANLYRILSGFTHSVPWALLAQSEYFQGELPGHKWARVELNAAWLIALLKEVLMLHDIALERLAAQLGEGPERWRTVLQSLPDVPQPASLLRQRR